MFLSQRATEAEYFDLPRPHPELAQFYSSRARVNRTFLAADPVQQHRPGLVGDENCRRLTLLDIGAGDGSLGVSLAEWASTSRDWRWHFTNCDISVPALSLGRNRRNVAGSVLALPFADSSFDVVMASQLTHHLVTDADIVRHLREAWRVARTAVILSDLHRGPLLYGLLRVAFPVFGYPRGFRAEGLLSVRRGFRVRELRDLAGQAGLDQARVSLCFGARVVLQARKPTTFASR